MTISARKFTKLSINYIKDEEQLISALMDQDILSKSDQEKIKSKSIEIVSSLRNMNNRESFVDQLLQEYGLSSDEGKTLMRLSEALIRTPDTHNAHSLLRDKLWDGDWSAHSGQSKSFMVNRSTNGLSLCSAWIRSSGGKDANNLLAKMGDTLIHTAIKQVMRYMGNHFVLGRNIDEARENRKLFDLETTCFSYDMLGEAAFTSEDAMRYFTAYEHAVKRTAQDGPFDILEEAPSISVKLSAIHPRYEITHAQHCMADIHQKLRSLCLIAKESNFAITIDAEECERLELSLAIIENLCADKSLDGWNGLSIVVQAYQRRALPVIDHIISLCRQYNRKLMVRLVKGAYWDSEIKRAQEMGLGSYPVFTRKENTDLNYIACADKLLAANDIIFPQFATHNAQTAVTTAYLAQKYEADFEFQRLQGMGLELHKILSKIYGVKSRIYAPVGAHKDLLPYLVRRLLENGANSSFVNQLSNDNVAIENLCIDPMAIISKNTHHQNDNIPAPREHLANGRISAPGFDWTQILDIERMEKLLSISPKIHACSIINGQEIAGKKYDRLSPVNRQIKIGTAQYVGTDIIDDALIHISSAWADDYSLIDRAAILRNIADNLFKYQDELLTLLAWEAGKTLSDAVAELREAVDFCYYYADEAETQKERKPLGIVACISPWNFPLAIFMGQIAASLVMGNIIFAKPAEQTPLIAYKITKIMFESGLPSDAFHLIIGDGAQLGHTLTSHKNINAICFTGSTQTAKKIAHVLADTNRADIAFIAETGGINSMIIDSTALMEQAIRDVIASAFQSAGQRCSACRLVYVQDDIADDFITMLQGAMQNLQMGEPQYLSTDIGPVIDEAALAMIKNHINNMQNNHQNVSGQVNMKNIENGSFVAPHAFEIDNISDLNQEVFGPILHIIRFKSENYQQILHDINAMGYGLTMGVHTRIDRSVERVAEQAKVGNLYINRNQIGAVVGVQPFGGEGLSGTGPKAGGPHYLKRLSKAAEQKPIFEISSDQPVSLIEEEIEFLASISPFSNHDELLQILASYYAKRDISLYKLYNDASEFAVSIGHETIMPGPTGESNILSLHPRGNILCMGGDNIYELHQQMAIALSTGNSISILGHDNKNINSNYINIINDNSLILSQYNGIAIDGAMRQSVSAKAARLDGPIMAILSAYDEHYRYMIERCVTIDTTAAGGNASLLAAG